MAGQMRMLYVVAPVHPLGDESVAVIVKLNGPEAVGVPESTPPVLSVRPAGKVPEVTANEYGAVAPLAVMVWLYATFTVPFGSVAGDTVMGAQLPPTVRMPVPMAVWPSGFVTVMFRAPELAPAATVT